MCESDVFYRWGESFAFYPDVPSILLAASAISITIAAASRTSAPDLANQMLKLLYLRPLPLTNSSTPLSPTTPTTPTFTSSNNSSKDKRAIDVFSHLQIFPGDKKQHFTKLKKQSGLPFEEMLFFDDETRNRNVETLGVVMWLVCDGVSRAEVDKGVREWRRRNGRERSERCAAA